jgi:hypothetical protein
MFNSSAIYRLCESDLLMASRIYGMARWDCPPKGELVVRADPQSAVPPPDSLRFSSKNSESAGFKLG